MAVSGFIFDVDGCVALGPNAIPGAPQALRELREKGYRMVFCTNESSRTRDAMAERLTAMGIEASPAEFVTAAEVAAEYMRKHHPGANVFAIGSPVLLQALQDRGARLLDVASPERAEVVLVGRDDKFSYEKLAAACRHIWAGAKFVAINLDRKLPTHNGLVPGTGALIASVIYATEREPTVLGKPSRYAVMTALEQLGLGAPQVAVVGDQLDADIRMGHAAGCETVLVLTGGSTQEDADNATGDRRPGFVLPGVRDLPAWLEEQKAAG